MPVPCKCACWCECECTCGKACGLARAVGGACECAVRSSARASAREVCELARAEQRRVLIPHGVKRHPLGIGGVDGRSLRRVVVWRAASPMHSTAMLETCEIGATGPHSTSENKNAQHVGPGEIEERRAWLDVASLWPVSFVALSAAGFDAKLLRPQWKKACQWGNGG